MGVLSNPLPIISVATPGSIKELPARILASRLMQARQTKLMQKKASGSTNWPYRYAIYGTTSCQDGSGPTPLSQVKIDLESAQAGLGGDSWMEHLAAEAPLGGYTDIFNYYGTSSGTPDNPYAWNWAVQLGNGYWGGTFGSFWNLRADLTTCNIWSTSIRAYAKSDFEVWRVSMTDTLDADATRPKVWGTTGSRVPGSDYSLVETKRLEAGEIYVIPVDTSAIGSTSGYGVVTYIKWF